MVEALLHSPLLFVVFVVVPGQWNYIISLQNIHTPSHGWTLFIDEYILWQQCKRNVDQGSMILPIDISGPSVSMFLHKATPLFSFDETIINCTFACNKAWEEDSLIFIGNEYLTLREDDLEFHNKIDEKGKFRANKATLSLPMEIDFFYQIQQINKMT